MNNDEVSVSVLIIKISLDDYEFKKLELFDLMYE